VMCLENPKNSNAKKKKTHRQRTVQQCNEKHVTSHVEIIRHLTAK